LPFLLSRLLVVEIKYGIRKISIFVNQDGLPIGRKKWITSERFCGEGEKTQLLTLTKCSEDEFTCNDGSCQPLENRCDLKQDCEDRSDEKLCQKVVVDGE
jgi:hypothetical protein